MKQRVISSLVGLVLLGVVIFFHQTIIFNITMAVVALIATYELLNATQLVKYKGLAALSAGFSLLLPFAQAEAIKPIIPLFVLVLSVGFFIAVIYYHNDLKFEQMSMAALFSLFVPLFFSCAVYLRDSFPVPIGLYYLILALGSAWLSDTGAYFAGMFFGKHKLAPVISPKKTIEGAVGGIITAIVMNIILAKVFSMVMASSGTPVSINYLFIAFVTPFISGMGIIGDLVASVIKRQYGVKDYGHIMPGHGGIMDRFDSVLLTLPTVFVIVRFVAVAVPV